MFNKIKHIEIVSSNMDRTMNFYTEVLGFKELGRHFG
ncbi:VOC family protein [Chloroflexota bacterium]